MSEFRLDNGGKVWTDETGAIWWQAPGRDPECLADADSLCGVGIFETGPDDPFRDCCTVHDNFYSHRAMFEEWGRDREWMDGYFLELMLQRAGDDKLLQAKAYSYYNLVREFGWIPYYRHPGKPNVEKGSRFTGPARPLDGAREASPTQHGEEFILRGEVQMRLRCN